MSALTTRRSRHIIVELAQVVALAAALYLVLALAVQPVRVQGSSMYPTVRDQDYLLAARLPYRLQEPQRGDVVILRDPQNPKLSFIKRVVALPGERLLIRTGTVYIDGHVIAEPYLQRRDLWVMQSSWPLSGVPVRLGPDEYFVMGDNRNNSDDSRTFGPIHRDAIVAHAWIRLLPPTVFGPVDSVRPRATG